MDLIWCVRWLGIFLGAAALLAGANVSAEDAALNSAPPISSWENWIVAVKTGAKFGLPGRPDHKALADELPLWVDCHLSWIFDRPSEAKPAIARQLILKSTPKKCAGQLEEWVR